MKPYDGQMKLVQDFDLDRYMGTWYVIADKPTFLEKSCVGGIEQYERRDDGGVDIQFTCFEDNLRGERKVYDARAWVLNPSNWKVQFFWPIKFSFLVLALEDDFQWTVIGHPSKKYAWIMNRQRQMPKEKLEKAKKILMANGYKLSDLRINPQPSSETEVPKRSLERLQWKNRLIVLFGNDSEKVTQQNIVFGKAKDAKEERKILEIFSDELSAEDRGRLLKQAGFKGQPEFLVMLVGLDGKVKWKSESLVNLGKIFQEIDQMPMRQQELQN